MSPRIAANSVSLAYMTAGVAAAAAAVVVVVASVAAVVTATLAVLAVLEVVALETVFSSAVMLLGPARKAADISARVCWEEVDVMMEEREEELEEVMGGRKEGFIGT